MTRRLLALFAPSMLAAENNTYYITFPNTNGCFVDPIRVEAKDRLEALVKCGATVWSEAEWEDAMRNEQLKEMVQKHRCISKEPKR